jgi:hypothetical protein
MDGSNNNMLVADIMTDFGYPEIAKDVQSSFGCLLSEYQKLCIFMATIRKDDVAMERLAMAGMIY